MKKLALLSIILFLFAGCNSRSYTQNQSTIKNSQNPTQSLENQTQTYRNGTYGFEFQYPTNMLFVTPSYAHLQDKIVELQIPQGTYPKTNFVDAAFSVSASYSKSLADCLAQNPPEGTDGFKTKATIGGQIFYKTKSYGAAAGNRYASAVYRALLGTQTCIELNETIHTADIHLFTPGTAAGIDANQVSKKLDNILNTFKFNLNN